MAETAQPSKTKPEPNVPPPEGDNSGPALQAARPQGERQPNTERPRAAPLSAAAARPAAAEPAAVQKPEQAPSQPEAEPASETPPARIIVDQPTAPEQELSLGQRIVGFFNPTRGTPTAVPTPPPTAEAAPSEPEERPPQETALPATVAPKPTEQPSQEPLATAKAVPTPPPEKPFAQQAKERANHKYELLAASGGEITVGKTTVNIHNRLVTDLDGERLDIFIGKDETGKIHKLDGSQVREILEKDVKAQLHKEKEAAEKAAREAIQAERERQQASEKEAKDRVEAERKAAEEEKKKVAVEALKQTPKWKERLAAAGALAGTTQANIKSTAEVSPVTRWLYQYTANFLSKFNWEDKEKGWYIAGMAVGEGDNVGLTAFMNFLGSGPAKIIRFAIASGSRIAVTLGINTNRNGAVGSILEKYGVKDATD